MRPSLRPCLLALSLSLAFCLASPQISVAQQSLTPPQGWQADTGSQNHGKGWLHGDSLSTLNITSFTLSKPLWTQYQASLRTELTSQGFTAQGSTRRQKLSSGQQASVHVWQTTIDGQNFTAIVVDLGKGDKQWQLTAFGLLDDEYTRDTLERDLLSFAAQL